jgi:2-epi-5-epi-valiolone synthase
MGAQFRLDVVPDLFNHDNPALAGAWDVARRLVVVRDATAGDRGELLAAYLRAAQARGLLDDALLMDVADEETGVGACAAVVEAAVKAQLGRRDAFIGYGNERTGPVVAVAAASFRRYTAAVRIHRDLAALVACLRDGSRVALDGDPISALTRRAHVIVDEDGFLAASRVEPAESTALLLVALLDRPFLEQSIPENRSEGLAALVRLSRRLGPGHPAWRLGEAWMSLAPPDVDGRWRRAWSLLLTARVAHQLGILPAETWQSFVALADRVHPGLSTVPSAAIGRDHQTQQVLLPNGHGAELVTVDRTTLLTPAASVQVRMEAPVGFPVRFTSGVLDPDASALAELLPAGCRVLAVVDPYRPDQLDRVDRLLAGYHQRGRVSHFTTVATAAAERTKTMDEVTRVVRLAEDLRLDGNDRIIVIGGGAVMDIVGYAAYLYRGDTPYIRVPTTLVGMIDAGIGLKVGVNVNSHKNLLGAYHPPLACLCDLAFLRTLPAAELRCGLAEAVKMGAVCDARLFELIERHYPDVLATRDTPEVREILDRSVSTMLHQLSANPYEEDLRRLPDFGHEFGHALESLSGYRLRHGEAVAIGMALSSCVATATGRLDRTDLHRILALLGRIGLSLSDTVCDADVLWHKLRNDVVPHKAGRLHLVVPGPIGTGDFIDSIDEIDADMVRDACEELRTWPVTHD